MFEEQCSIYRDSHDTYKQYVDVETGEQIQQMSIHDFFCTDRFKPQVSRLHQMIAQMGEKEAKDTEEYKTIKASLPAATLSAIFGKYRRGTDVVSRTGWLCLDIDHADNPKLANFDWTVRNTLKHHPCVALAMHSCSGVGYLALVRVADPTRIKEHFNALWWQFKAMGIVLDSACSDITRLRYATWDPNIYINERARTYEEFSTMSPDRKMQRQVSYATPRTTSSTPRTYNQEDDYTKCEKLIEKAISRGVDLCSDYEEWIKVGMAMKTFGDRGFDLWKKMCWASIPQGKLLGKWRSFHNNVSIGWFMNHCRDHGVLFRD